LHLVTSRGEGGVIVVVAEELVGDRDHVGEILVIRADAAENAEHALDEKGWLHEPFVDEVRERIQMPDVVALELEARAAFLAELPEGVLDLVERVDEGT